LIRNVSNQVSKRLKDLPPNTKQTIIIDVRGQNVTNDVLRSIRNEIIENTSGKVEIRFKR
jgi:toxin YqcG